jgi:hypothetical protein
MELLFALVAGVAWAAVAVVAATTDELKTERVVLTDEDGDPC